jgi:hypothetical protein
MAQDITYAYFGGLTAKRGEDGYIRVKGLATDATLDLDEQICDPEWLKTAMPEWFAIGNIREMHQSKAIGKAMEMEQSGTGYIVEAKIVDSEAARLVEEGIYTGFSVGIKGARVEKSADAPGGMIRSGKIVEVSLVDRPANPSCVIELAKSVKGKLVKGTAMADIEKDAINTEATMTEPEGSPTEVYDAIQACTACAGTGKKTNTANEEFDTPCDVCNGTGEQPEGMVDDIVQNSPTIPQNMDNRDIKAADADDTEVTDPEVEKREFSTAERDAAAESGAAMPDGSFPIKSAKDLMNAIRAIGRAKDRAKTIAHIVRRAKALGREDLIPDSFKAVEHDEATLESVRAGIVALIKAELDEMLSGEEDEICDVRELLCALELFLCWWDGEADEGETVEPFMKEDEPSGDDTMAYIGLGVSADLIKSASAEDATEESKDELRTEIVKALGLEETITTKAALDEAKEEITLLKAALDEVREMAVPGGPAIRATREQTSKSAHVIAAEVEAIRLRDMAQKMTNPDLRNQYLAEASRYEAKAKQSN